MDREGLDWIRMENVRGKSVNFVLNSLPGTAAPDGAAISASVEDHFAKDLLARIEERDAGLPAGVECEQLMVSEVPGNRISFQFIWNGLPANSVILDWDDAKSLLADAIAAMRARRRAKAFA